MRRFLRRGRIQRGLKDLTGPGSAGDLTGHSEGGIGSMIAWAAWRRYRSRRRRRR